MDFTFSTGTRRFHADTNFNFQMNRLCLMGGGDFGDVSEAAGRIATLSDWKTQFLLMAEKAEAQGRLLNASGYYRSAEFFMPFSDPEKEVAFNKAMELFRIYAKDEFDQGLVSEHRVPYEKGFLPAWRLPAPASGSRGVLVLHGGFDSAKEELYPSADVARKAGFEVILFEGPGQGEVLGLQKIPMTHEWERPVNAVLDHFKLDGVTLVGLSLGGYLAMRAAAFSPRIKRVVAWDVIHDFFRVLSGARGPLLGTGIRLLSGLHADGLLDKIALKKAARDSFTAWGMDRGMGVFGIDRPSAVFHAAKRYNTRPFSEKVTQDVLLLAGTSDHFIPISLFHKEMRAYKNARSLTGRVFTSAENAADHCQIGNIPLALSLIGAWIIERTESLSTENAG
ncbi:MAG: alpha/beta fold hydrolase [Deltaproteobacteria bacterium]|nr:alpha/beta fold hydrolase [Deltaproteobacteria bacterium]